MPRRRTDPKDGHDYSDERKRYPVIVQKMNGHFRWIVAAVSASILSLAGWGVVSYRESIEKRLNSGEQDRSELRMQINTLATQQAATTAESRQFREEVLRSLARIEATGRVVRKAVE